MSDPGLEINVDLFGALAEILGAEPRTPDPIVVLSEYLYRLAQGYGLSESLHLTESQLERADLPAPAVALVNHYLADGAASIDGDSLRDRLYATFIDLSRDRSARKALNKNEPLSEVGLLTVAQIYWNLEATNKRPSLPKFEEDFATMTWTKRVARGATGLGAGQARKSSGQGFRTKGARLAVLAAQYLVDHHSQPPPGMNGASLRVIASDLGNPTALIVWPIDDRVVAAPTLYAPELVEERQLRTDVQQVLVGMPADVGASYQRRGFDATIEQSWADGGDRRLWLRGGPGRGKSYSARRVMQDALSNQGDDRERLLIWVDAADARTVLQSLSAAVDDLPEFRLSVNDKTLDETNAEKVNRQARSLLHALETSRWRWLIVLDNAAADELIAEKLVPTGRNPNGRMLITTLSPAHRIDNHGRVIETELFTPEEAEAFLRHRLARASSTDTRELAGLVGYHPLALSIAAATIVANAMDVGDWIAEFGAARRMDDAADEADTGGYPSLIGATWRVALDKASQGLQSGVVERSAAVAALLAPDGHPTWLWERTAVTAWVAGDATLARRPGRPPVAIQRLIDNGIIDLVGGAWKGGQIAIHQLAARAIRELVPKTDLEELGGIIANEFLLRLGEDERGTLGELRGNMQSLVSAVDRGEPARSTAIALLGFAELGNDSENSDRWSLEAQLANAQKENRVIESVVEHVGAQGKSRVASSARYLGLTLTKLGSHGDAHEHFTRAAQIYRTIVDDREVDDEDRAEALVNLAAMLDLLGHDDEAGAHRAQAVTIYGRLVDSDPGVEKSFDYVTALSELHMKLGDPGERDAVLLGNYAQLLRVVDLEPTLIAEDRLEFTSEEIQYTLRVGALWQHQCTLGKLDDAKVSLDRAAASCRHIADGRWARDWDRILVRLHVETSCWAEAEDCLSQLVGGQGREDDSTLADDLVRLASIQMHNDRRGDAATNVARAAIIYQTIEPKPRSIESDREAPTGDALVSLLQMGQEEFLAKRWGNAQHVFAAAVDQTMQRADANPGNNEHILAGALLRYGFSHLQAGQPNLALEPFTRAISIVETLTVLTPSDLIAQGQFSIALLMLGNTHSCLGQKKDAVAAYGRAVAGFQRIVDADPAVRDAQTQLALALCNLADALSKHDRLDEGRDAYERAIAISQALIDSDPDDPDAHANLAKILHWLGEALVSYGRLDEAADRWNEQEALLRDFLVRKSNAHALEIALADALLHHGFSYAQHDRFDDAAASLSRAVVVYQNLPEDDAGSTDETHAMTHYLLADVHTRLYQTDQQLAHLTKAVELYRRFANQNLDDQSAQFMLAGFLILLGEACSGLDRGAEAIEHLTGAANILELLVDLGTALLPTMLQCAAALHQTVNLLGDTLRTVGRSEEAEVAFARADELVRRFPELDAR